MGCGDVEGVVGADVPVVLPGQWSQEAVRDAVHGSSEQVINDHVRPRLLKMPVQDRSTQH